MEALRHRKLIAHKRAAMRFVICARARGRRRFTHCGGSCSNILCALPLMIVGAIMLMRAQFSYISSNFLQIVSVMQCARVSHARLHVGANRRHVTRTSVSARARAKSCALPRASAPSATFSPPPLLLLRPMIAHAWLKRHAATSHSQES